MTEKHGIAEYIAQCAVLALAVLLLVASTLRDAGTKPADPRRAVVSGEYSLDGGDFRPLKSGSMLAGRTLVLRGSFTQAELGEGSELRFFLNHVGGSLSVNGAVLWEDRSDEGGVCGRKWSSWTAPALSGSDAVEITLTNFHSFGNGYAFRSFLDNVYVCADAAFETYMLRKSLPERLAGFTVIAIACVLIGLGFGSLRRGDIAKRLFHWGFFAMFAGAYVIFDTINFSINFSSMGFGTAGRFMSVVTAGAMFSLCAADPLRGRAGAAARYIAMAQSAVAAALFVITAAGAVGAFGAQYVWIPVQACASLGLIGCVFAHCRAHCGDRTPLLYLPMLAAWLMALVNAVFGLCVHGVLVKAVFLLTFAAFLAGELRSVIAAQRRAERARELEQELKMSRIILATSQIRSHFIFNVLNAISGMCKYDPRLADETVVRFARYLRSNVDVLGNDALTPVSTELRHVDDYICLEQMRFGSRIEFIAEMETDDFPVPPLILQPLVENAVKHGILPKKRDGMIRLRVFSEGESNVITVSDDGVGFDAEKPLREGAVGLENVRFRLETMVHGALEIRSEQGVGTTITITIPRG